MLCAIAIDDFFSRQVMSPVTCHLFLCHAFMSPITRPYMETNRIKDKKLATFYRICFNFQYSLVMFGFSSLDRLVLYIE